MVDRHISPQLAVQESIIVSTGGGVTAKLLEEEGNSRLMTLVSKVSYPAKLRWAGLRATLSPHNDPVYAL